MGDDAARFAQLWTAKEAMLKCRGAALGRLRHLPLAMTPDGPAAQQGALRLFLPARAGEIRPRAVHGGIKKAGPVETGPVP